MPNTMKLNIDGREIIFSEEWVLSQSPIACAITDAFMRDGGVDRYSGSAEMVRALDELEAATRRSVLRTRRPREYEKALETLLAEHNTRESLLLRDLLADPHPGLFTWNQACSEAAAAILLQKPVSVLEKALRNSGKIEP